MSLDGNKTCHEVFNGFKQHFFIIQIADCPSWEVEQVYCIQKTRMPSKQHSAVSDICNLNLSLISGEWCGLLVVSMQKTPASQLIMGQHTLLTMFTILCCLYKLSVHIALRLDI